jgi:glucose-6-phosphate 1-dehydrogenase
LPERFAVVGTARSEWTDNEFRDRMEHAVREFGRDDFKQEVWDRLADATQYLPMDFADESKADQLMSRLNRVDEE